MDKWEWDNKKAILRLKQAYNLICDYCEQQSGNCKQCLFGGNKFCICCDIDNTSKPFTDMSCNKEVKKAYNYIVHCCFRRNGFSCKGCILFCEDGEVCSLEDMTVESKFII